MQFTANCGAVIISNRPNCTAVISSNRPNCTAVISSNKPNCTAVIISNWPNVLVNDDCAFKYPPARELFAYSCLYLFMAKENGTHVSGRYSI